MLLGVRVQVGIGVREAVGVEESIATNVFLCTVMTARAVRVPLSIPSHEADNVIELVTRGRGLDVGELDSGAVEVWLGLKVSVCDGADERVKVQAGDAAGAVPVEMN